MAGRKGLGEWGLDTRFDPTARTERLSHLKAAIGRRGRANATEGSKIRQQGKRVELGQRPVAYNCNSCGGPAERPALVIYAQTQGAMVETVGHSGQNNETSTRQEITDGLSNSTAADSDICMSIFSCK